MKIFGPYSTLGLTTAAVALVVDQAHKAWVIGPMRLGERGRVHITPFLDFVLTWNPGISYGLLKQNAVGPWLLALFACVTAVGIALWMARLYSPLTAVSAGAIMGGALSNAADRMRFGAVADYVSLHAGPLYWYIFNIADVAIVAGVAGLLYDWRTSSHKTAGNEI